jgi:hypothetical protein
VTARTPHTLTIAVRVTVTLDLDSWNAAYGPEPLDTIRDAVRSDAERLMVYDFAQRGITADVRERSADR